MCTDVILLVLFITLTVIYIITLKSHYKYFVRRNISGPSPKLFFGNLLEIWKEPLSYKVLHKWTLRYGPIYGLFEGINPVYIVSDVDFLQDIYIKQFSSFHSRRVDFLSRFLLRKGSHLFFAQGNQWRRQRHIINPTFTASKLKSMTPIVNKCIESMVRKIDGMSGEEFDIFILYKRLLMDVIWHCIFGIETDMQSDIDNIYMKQSQASTDMRIENLSIVKLSFMMPFLIPVLTLLVKIRIFLVDVLQAILPSRMHKVEDLPMVWIMKKVNKVIEERNKSGQKRSDLLQHMLDVTSEDGNKKYQDDESVTKHLYQTEMLMNIFLFMVAGFETTATALAFSTYTLATEPEVYKKLQAEVDHYWQQNQDELNYDDINNMSYLDLFLREVLRLYTFSGNVRLRQCNETTIVCGHTIEKGSTIMPDVYMINRHADLWGPDDVNQFVPERHSTERHPAAFLAFGIGPRSCVGMRFAWMVLKLSLTHLLHEHRILPGDKLQEGLRLRAGNVVSPEAVYVRFEKKTE